MIERVQHLANGAGVRATGPATITVALSTGPLPIEVRATPAGADLVAVWSAPPPMASLDLAPLARVTALARTGMLRCEAHPGNVVIIAPLFSDGLTQHAVLTAATEVGKTYEVLNVAAAEWQEQRAAAADAARRIAEIDAALSTPKPPPQPAPNGWHRTHVGPPDGLAAWGAPDQNSQSTRLPANLELQVIEFRGGWASVVAQNGWYGWVDARVLRPAT